MKMKMKIESGKFPTGDNSFKLSCLLFRGLAKSVGCKIVGGVYWHNNELQDRCTELYILAEGKKDNLVDLGNKLGKTFAPAGIEYTEFIEGEDEWPYPEDFMLKEKKEESSDNEKILGGILILSESCPKSQEAFRDACSEIRDLVASFGCKVVDGIFWEKREDITEFAMCVEGSKSDLKELSKIMASMLEASRVVVMRPFDEDSGEWPHKEDVYSMKDSSVNVRSVTNITNPSTTVH